MTDSPLVLHLLTRIRQTGLPDPVLECRFHPTRKWAFDLCWPALMLACEVDGGTWSGGRHTRGAGFERDCRKLNAAAELGWRVVRFTSGMVTSDEAIMTLERLLVRDTPRTQQDAF